MNCGKCNIDKPLTDFYSCGSPCKKCRIEYVAKWASENLDKVREYKRRYGNSARGKNITANWRIANREKIALKARIYVESAGGHTISLQAARDYAIRNPENRRAYATVGRALKSGRLVRKPCNRCGKIKNVHAHHKDYSKPLSVEWLCVQCHHKHHVEQRIMEGR